MKAYFFYPQTKKFKLQVVDLPHFNPHEVLIEVESCGVCHTDLHIIDGELPYKKEPHVLGHQTVGRIVEKGKEVDAWKIGDRVGITWLGSTCQKCRFCLQGKENLCSKIQFTGYDTFGGFSEYTKAHQDYIFALPEKMESEQLAPLLCAGIIGFRGYEKILNANHIAFYGFGSSAFLTLQLALKDKKKITVLTKPKDSHKQKKALEYGAYEALDSTEAPKEPFEGSLIFASVGSLVPHALKNTEKGGTVVCCGIHMDPIPSFPYHDLWNEKTLLSIANLTRKSARDYLSKIGEVALTPLVNSYSLEELEQAILDFRLGSNIGSYVIKIK